MKFFLTLLVCALGTCTLAQSSTSVTADIVSTENTSQVLGTATAQEGADGGVVVTFDIGSNTDISGGEHAIHIHENGACGLGDSDDDGVEEAGGAAGGHYNPTDVGHGEDNGPHVGDSELYNYTFNDDGSFSGEVVFPQASLEGENPLLKEGGTAIMIHEGTDDKETDPGGNAGSRVACGVITAQGMGQGTGGQGTGGATGGQ